MTIEKIPELKNGHIGEHMRRPDREGNLGPGSPAVCLDQVTKRYGSVRALDNVSLSVAPGSFVTLLGPSGSGKTTLLQVLAGFVEPDEGVVQAHGVDITETPAHRRNIGMVFQHYALFPHLSVRDNIAYSLRIRGVPKAARLEAVDRFLGLVEMPDLGARYPDELSGGQQQRVALARALVFGPEVVLLDEALSALDRRLRQTLQFTIKRIQREVGSTFIHVTHDQDEALAMSDVIVLMRDGAIEQIGTPLELYSQPATPFAARFMGEANLLRVERAGSGAGFVHRDTKEAFKVHVRLVPVAADESVPLLCVRPEELRLDPTGAEEGLSGRVTLGTFMGDHWRYEVRVGEDVLICNTARNSHAEVGDIVRLVFPDHALPVFVTN